MGKIIGITYDLKTDWKFRPDDPADANAELDSGETLDFVVAALEANGHKVKKIGSAKNLLEQIDNLDVDIVFNICEGFHGRNRESQVPLILEMYGIPYVGSDALTLGVTLDKILAKKCFIADGIPTPRYFEAYEGDDLKALYKKSKMRFPLIAKPKHEGSSKGLSEKSRVTDFEGLKRQVDLINQKYYQAALVEEFIKGSEFTVPVLGNKNPQAMPVAQVHLDGNVNLGDNFYTQARLTYDGLGYVCPPRISAKMIQKLQQYAVKAYQSVGCLDFGRVDFRVDEKGRPFVLEINPLPSLAKKDVFNIFPYTMGSTFEKTIDKIVNFALERYGMLNGRTRSSSSSRMRPAANATK
jgi:D-alanine-D-alanine ligase